MAVFPAFFVLLVAALVSGQDVDINPRSAVRRLGDNLTVICKVPYKIDSCRMTVGRNTYRLEPNGPDSDVMYDGRGLDYGECGGQIRRIREDWNGNITCIVPQQNTNIEVSKSMRLYVARAPGDPQLVSPPQSAFKEGDVFMAQCVVPNGRPAAKITWFLGEEQLQSGVHQPFVTPSDPTSDLLTVSQNYSRTLAAADHGRSLLCKAEHEALDQPRIATRQLIVYYPPKRLDAGPITIFGLKLGTEGRLNVTIRANPAPLVQWTVGSQRLQVGQTNDDASVTVLEPIAMGDGYYNLSLVLANVRKEDVERTYYVSVRNDVGGDEFPVRISTMDEPAGVELGAGAIAGIVVAILVLLVAIFLIVFAKATDRWCFSGRSHRTDIPDGVDSEAPLPPHDDIKGSENPSHDPADYITNAEGFPFKLRSRDHPKNSGESTPAGDVLIESGIPLSSKTDTESAVGGKTSRLADLTARVRAALPRRDKVQAQKTDAEDKPLSEDKKNVVYAELALTDQSGEKPPPPPSTEYAEIAYTDQQPPKTDSEPPK